jgi:hypothetical protein
MLSVCVDVCINEETVTGFSLSMKADNDAGGIESVFLHRMEVIHPSIIVYSRLPNHFI